MSIIRALIHNPSKPKFDHPNDIACTTPVHATMPPIVSSIILSFYRPRKVCDGDSFETVIPEDDLVLDLTATGFLVQSELGGSGNQAYGWY